MATKPRRQNLSLIKGNAYVYFTIKPTYYKGEHVYCLKGQFRMRLMSVGILPRMELIFEWGAVYTFTTAARSSRVTALNYEL